MPSSSNALTFDEIATTARRSREKARSKEARRSWDDLLDLIAEHQGQDDANAALLIGEPWKLARVEICGFRGVATPLSLTLPTSRGITLVHGANGSGKSSISHAIELALAQAANSVDGPSRGGKASPWSPVLSCNGQTANINVQLERADERLALHVRYTPRGDGTYAAEHGATLTSADGNVSEPTLDGDWRASLASFLPTYSYADWERGLSTNKDLQGYLQNLLALGSCFTVLRRAVDGRESVAKRAHDRIEEARNAAQRSLDELDRQETAPTIRVRLPEDFSSDPDVWWQSQELDDLSLAAAVTAPWIPDVRKVLDALPELKAKLDRLRRAAPVEVGLVHTLRALQDQTKVSEEECPVCGTATAWRDHLADRLTSFQESLEALESWKSSLDAVSQAIHAGSDAESATSPNLDRFRRRLRVMAAELTASGAGAEATLNACDQLFAVEPDGVRAELTALSEAADRASTANRRAVHIARRFVDVWREEHSVAREKVQWFYVRKCLDTLEKNLKDERSKELTNNTNQFVSALLADAGLSLRGLEVQKTQAKLTLNASSTSADGGAEGPEVQLGMLSAGQRNAVILAPALAVATSGPFGFMVLDDPVHAFDELRVDRLANALVQIAESRRVVVMTHDERLREQLLASHASVDLLNIARTPEGAVTVSDANAIWSLLIDDAENLKELGHLQQMTTPIRGLLRQAVDNAFRLFVTREAVRSHASPDEWLKILDAPANLKLTDRLQALEGLSLTNEGRDHLSTIRPMLETYNEPWNRAMHGQVSAMPGMSTAKDDEITTARTICSTLTGAPRV